MKPIFTSRPLYPSQPVKVSFWKKFWEFVFHIGMILACTFIVYGGIAVAQELNFETPRDVPASIPLPAPVKVVEEDYKATRAKEICEMVGNYDGLIGHCDLLVAHLLTECGAMTEYCGWSPGKSSNDHGWAFGMAQWHLYYREEAWLKKNGFTYPSSNIVTVRDAFFADHPELREWRGQVKRYLGEMRDCVKDKTLEACIDNWNAGWLYMTKVKGNLKEARKLLAVAPPHFIVIHATDIAGKAEQAEIINRVHCGRKYPKGINGSCIAYHYLIGKDGTILQNHADTAHTPHTSCDEKFPELCLNGHVAINEDSIAVALAGDFDVEQPTPQQVKSLKTLLARLEEKYDIPVDHVIPHREASATGCPGKYLLAIISSQSFL